MVYWETWFGKRTLSDGWGEFFRYDLWTQAFEECGIDPEFYSRRKRELDEILPWEHIDVGVKKEFLVKELERALL